MNSNEMLPVAIDGPAVDTALNGNDLEQDSTLKDIQPVLTEQPRSRQTPRSKTARTGAKTGSKGAEAPSEKTSRRSPRRSAAKPRSTNDAADNEKNDVPVPAVAASAAAPAQTERLPEIRVELEKEGVSSALAYPLFDLHQDPELWPEAWPDEGLEHTANTVQRAQNSLQVTVRTESSLPGQEEGNASAASQAAPEFSANSVSMQTKPVSEQSPREETAEISEEDLSSRTSDPAIVPSIEQQREDVYNETQNSTTSNPKRAGNEKSAAATKSAPVAKGKKRKMFISVLPGEQVEVAITEENQVQEYYVQMLHQLKTKGNIYKGVIHNVDANLQAAFVSYGAHKNGFLQIDEVHPDYYLVPHDPSKGKKYPLIQKVLKPGQEVLVQVVKEPTGGKGAFLSTYLSIPGRFLVLTPGRTQFGVSRKVEDENDRERLRSLLDSLPTQDGLGVIVRTASLSASKTSMLKDLQVLKRQWKEVRARGTTESAPCLVYEEPSLAGRAVRDYLSDDIVEIWVDDAETAQEIKDTVSLIFPRRASTNLIKLHDNSQRTMWETFDLRRQIEQIYLREVNLPSGGRLVFDQTEALMAIDINSGKIAGRNNFESMALRTNMEAAQVIASQLRLRDIGGQIVIDFIEMRERSHWRELEKVMRNAMKSDRARYDVAKVSSFGLMEVVRQRLGSSSISVTMEPCPCCSGTGLRRNMEWQALSALRDLQHLALHKNSNEKNIVYEAEPEVALYLLNNKRGALAALEERYDVDVEIRYRR